MTVVQDGRDELALLSWYLEFWLDSKISSYWIGSEAAPWYADLSGPPGRMLELTDPSYIVAPIGFELYCPAGRGMSEITQGLALSIVVLEVSESGCGTPR